MTCKAPVFGTALGTQWHARGHGYCSAYHSGHYEVEDTPDEVMTFETLNRFSKKENAMVKSGENLVVGRWYRIVEIDPHDPDPSLKVGHILECKAEAPGCIDPENHANDGMGTQWFADYGPVPDDDEVAYRTLVTRVELYRGVLP